MYAKVGKNGGGLSTAAHKKTFLRIQGMARLAARNRWAKKLGIFKKLKLLWMAM
jgi:hypothetical protein